jgi:hypothetical protein
VEAAGRILKRLAVELHPQKTRIVHVKEGFEFLGYKIKRGQKKLHLPASQIRSQARQGALYACGAGASITNAPTSASSSNVSTAGSGDAFGRIATGVGAMLAGNACLWPSFTASTSLCG